MWKYKKTILFMVFYSLLLVLFTTSFNKSKLNINLIFHLNEFFILLLAYFSDIVIERRNQSLEIFRFPSRKAYFYHKFTNGLKHISFLMFWIMMVHGGIVYFVRGELPLWELIQYSFHLWSVLVVVYFLILSNITKRHYLVKGYVLIIVLYVMYVDMEVFENRLFLITNLLAPFFRIEAVSIIQIILIYSFYIFLAYWNYDARWREIEG